MPAKYLIRFDDASEYMNYKKWIPYFDLLDKYSIKPIIAVIPFNKDPKLINDKPDIRFWEKVRVWQNKGYQIAIHGYEHLYRTQKSGVIGINNRSEFAGLPLKKQEHMISSGYKKFLKEKVRSNIFIAPAHSFDKNTIRALMKCSDIKYISDGFFLTPIIKDGLKWIPQQLWIPKVKKRGVWTICYHPENDSWSKFELLQDFVKNNNVNFINISNLEFDKSISVTNVFFNIYQKIYMKLLKNYNHVTSFYNK